MDETELRFDGVPLMFDGVEIGAVGWEELDVAADFFDQFSGAIGLMKAGIVEDDRLAWLEAGSQ